MRKVTSDTGIRQSPFELNADAPNRHQERFTHMSAAQTSWATADILVQLVLGCFALACVRTVTD
jgi:hypothetical protein